MLVNQATNTFVSATNLTADLDVLTNTINSIMTTINLFIIPLILIIIISCLFVSVTCILIILRITKMSKNTNPEPSLGPQSVTIEPGFDFDVETTISEKYPNINDYSNDSRTSFIV